MAWASTCTAAGAQSPATTTPCPGWRRRSSVAARTQAAWRSPSLEAPPTPATPATPTSAASARVNRASSAPLTGRRWSAIVPVAVGELSAA